MEEYRKADMSYGLALIEGYISCKFDGNAGSGGWLQFYNETDGIAPPLTSKLGMDIRALAYKDLLAYYRDATRKRLIKVAEEFCSGIEDFDAEKYKTAVGMIVNHENDLRTSLGLAMAWAVQLQNLSAGEIHAFLENLLGDNASKVEDLLDTCGKIYGRIS